MSDSDSAEFFKIKVRPTAKEAITRWKQRTGSTEIALASRVYEWFGRQPEDVQRAILGLFTDDDKEIARIVAESLLGKARGRDSRGRSTGT